MTHLPVYIMHYLESSMHGHGRVCLNLDVSLLQKDVTSLFFASQEGCTQAVKLLLEHGAQVDLQDNVSHVFITRKNVFSLFLRIT